MRDFSRAEIYQQSDINFYKLNPLPYDCPDSIRLNFNNNVADGYWDILRLSSDILVYIVDNHYTTDFTIPYQSGRDHMVFRFALSGAMEISSNRDPAILLEGPCLNYFSTSKKTRIELRYRKGSDHRMITVYVSRKKIRDIVRPGQGSGSDLENVNRLFAGESRRGCNLVLTPEIKDTIIDIFSTQFFGPLRKVFVKAKAHELLCYAIKHIGSELGGDATETISARDQEKVRQVFEVLNGRYIDPPHISEIARTVGLNRTVLRKYFKTIYGKTISEFCVAKRMIEARSKLLNSDMNITQISHYLGYEHSGNFTTAFKRHYGVLPKDLKKH